MSCHNVKSGDIADARESPPPYHHTGLSTYAILNGPVNPADPEDSPPVLDTHAYCALQHQNRKLELITFILFCILLILLGGLFYAGSEVKRLGSELDSCHTNNIHGNESSLQRRASARRRCISGYTADELELEFQLMQTKYDHKARI